MPALRVSFTRAPLSDLSPALMKELGDKIASKHHLEGAWTRNETGCPIIAVSTDRAVGSKALKTRRGRGPLVGFTQGYQTGFGHTGTLTIGIEFVQERGILPVGRFCAPIQPVWLELFEFPQYPEVLLFRNQRPIERLKASISFKGLGFTPSEPVWLE